MINYSIISTGSQGNAVVIENRILIDCGVPYKAIEPYVHGLSLVLMTHWHGDHFRESTVKRLAYERPTLRFGCGEWMVTRLLRAEVKPRQIDLFRPWNIYRYGKTSILPVPLAHDVPNFGYKVHFERSADKVSKLFYATDTGNLNGIQAKGYDLYMVEANFETEEILQKIAEKKATGEFAYERRSLHYHLSKEKCDDFIYSNAGHFSEYVYMHTHIDEDPQNNEIQKGF